VTGVQTCALPISAVEGVRMGPLASRAQVRDVGANAAKIRGVAEVVFGGGDFNVIGADREKGAFFAPMLLSCDEPFTFSEPHDIEAFGPVNTVMPYGTIDDAIALAKLGRGSLCGSLFTADPKVARSIVLGVAPYHGRIMVLDRTSAKESTGHGSPLPNLVHGGPGRAGGGEELGGIRGVLHYMQRTALQGSPTALTGIVREYMQGAAQKTGGPHPFRKYFDELEIGDTLITGTREITLADVERFAELSATSSTRTWTMRPLARGSSSVASRTGISSSRPPQACSSIPHSVRCLRTTVWKGYGSRSRYIRAIRSTSASPASRRLRRRPPRAGFRRAWWRGTSR
jgi:phenylacetic acid degradation protein PaaN